jgi:hypothetical protein
MSSKLLSSGMGESPDQVAAWVIVLPEKKMRRLTRKIVVIEAFLRSITFSPPFNSSTK